MLLIVHKKHQIYIRPINKSKNTDVVTFYKPGVVLQHHAGCLSSKKRSRLAAPRRFFVFVSQKHIFYIRIIAIIEFELCFSSKNTILGVTAATTAAAEEFPAGSRPPSHRTQGSNISFGHLPSLRQCWARMGVCG